MRLHGEMRSWKMLREWNSWIVGLRERQHGVNRQKALRSLQHKNAAERESNSMKESLASQNTEMISSIVISQMIDENKSKENRSALPLQSVIAQPDTYHTKQSLANHGSVNINRAFTLHPSRLEIQASLDDSVRRTDSHTREEKQCHNQENGFASITITARRVVPPSNNTVQEAATDSPCLKCRGGNLLMNAATTASNNAGSAQHCRPLYNQGSCTNQNATRLKVPETYSQSCEGHQGWIFNSESKESRIFPPGSNRRKKAPVSFTSCIHLRISQQCPNRIYYVDKSLSVCVDRPQIKSQKIHRSILSFNINCSSPRLTPDGVDGIANGGPRAETLKRKLSEENKTLLRTFWTADLKENTADKKKAANKECLGTAYPWKGTPPSELLSFVDIPKGTNNVKATKKDDDDDDKQAGGNHIKLSIQVPKLCCETGSWTNQCQLLNCVSTCAWESPPFPDRVPTSTLGGDGWPALHPGTQTFSGSNRKQCNRDTFSATAPASLLERAPMKEFTADASGSLKVRAPSKATSKSKEIQAQWFLKPKIPVFNCVYDIKALPKPVLEENDLHRKNQFSKGDYKFCGSDDKIKECKKREKQGGALSAAYSPVAAHEKQAAFTQPEICSEPENIPSSPLTLREALEVHKPKFISRSQERLKKLEHMVQMRRAQHSESPGKKQGALLARKLSSNSISSKKKQYTIPHPLSDNLFKPKERFISEKEMHMRSKRIYNNLPEVKKKQEEKQKRVIIQSNRLRVEVFKKQLLEQLLQRNTE
ncbi:(E2-independent) E3 ubiquitin-conjugating enzyme FATS isoform X3 [Alligator mississippiensis]|uniref:(E2-independent) E3 ubiquitin-conjugating enzyme FATS isoform X3 n=1 Tax=Alligator mississippiensis TaxID=8496 RepID=UPI000907179B|nr:(E2-independent) E3 ubiquitin-conjugating enzyme FATS isoform X3 [Alligator mississippiensis]